MSTFDATAADQNLEFDQGDDEVINITRKDSDGNTIDITGYTFWLTIKASKSDSDADAVVQKTVTSHTDAVNGETKFSLADTDTDSLSGHYFYDIQEKTAGGGINTLMAGSMRFETDVTDSTS